MGAPGFGPVGFGIALLAIGGLLISKGHNVAGVVCDLLGVVSMWDGFRTYRVR